MDNREIKFKFNVDSQSMQQVERSLDQLIRKSQELAKSLNSASLGGMGGGMLSGKVGKSGPGGVKPTGTQGQTSFVGVVASQASVFQKLAQDGSNAMRSMGAAVSQGVSAQQAQINTLTQSLNGLSAAYAKTGAAAGGLGGKAGGTLMYGSGLPGGPARPGYYNPAGTGLLPGIPYPSTHTGMTGMFSPVDFTMQNQAKGMAAMMGQMSAQGGFGGGASLSGLFAGARGGLNAIGGASLPPGAQQALSMVPGGAMMARFMNPASALAAAGIWAATSAAKGVYDTPMFESRITGDIVSARDSYARKLRMGDTSDMRAMARIMSDPTKRANMEAMQGTGEQGLFSNMWEGKDAGGGKWGMRAAMVALGPLALLNSPAAMREAGIRGGAAWEAGSTGHFAVAANALTGDRSNPLIGKQTDAALKETINAETRAEGLRDEILAEGYANARGMASLQRGLGIGSGRKRDKTGKEIPGSYVSHAEKFAADYNMFSPEELIAATAGITAAGGRRSRFTQERKGEGNLFSSVLQAEAGGMTGMARFGGVFGREGGTRGRDMVDIARTIASQSDVGTASLMADYVAKTADQILMPGAVGAGTFGALAVGTGGADSGLIARQNLLGMASSNKVFSGDRDAWQKVANLSAVIGAAPGANYYAQQFMATHMTASRMAELEANGPLTQEEIGHGLTRDQLLGAGRAIAQTSAYRVATTGFTAGSRQQQWAAAMQKPGFNLKAEALKMFGGEDQKWSEAEKEEALNTAALVRSVQNDESFAAAKGGIREELFGYGAKGKKGKMVGDVSAGSRAAVELKTEAEIKKTELDRQDAFTEETDRQKKELAAAYKSMLGQSGNIAAASTVIAEILARHAKELRAVEKSLGAPKAGQPGKPTVGVDPQK